MKKIVLTLALGVIGCVSALAADMSDVWYLLSNTNGFEVSEIEPEKAAANGFETLSMAINTAPTSTDINNARRIAATVDKSQVMTTVSQKGVDVSIYAAPANADGSEYKMMIFVDKNDNEDKSLIVLYGTCSRDGIVAALRDLSLESIIGG